MASVTHRPKSGGWLVRWSEYAEEGGKRKRKMRSRFFADVETAAMYANSMNSIPAATAQRVLAAQRPAGATLADYLATLIASDSELRQASREVYEAGVRTHIAGTSLGATPVDLGAPAQLRQFWGALRCGPGARGGTSTSCSPRLSTKPSWTASSLPRRSAAPASGGRRAS